MGHGMGEISGGTGILAGNGGYAAAGCVAQREKACTNMVLGGSRKYAVQSVRSGAKGALRMTLWVRWLRGLCLVGAILSVPTAAIVQVIIREHWEHKQRTESNGE